MSFLYEYGKNRAPEAFSIGDEYVYITKHSVNIVFVETDRPYDGIISNWILSMLNEYPICKTIIVRFTQFDVKFANQLHLLRHQTKDAIQQHERSGMCYVFFRNIYDALDVLAVPWYLTKDGALTLSQNPEYMDRDYENLKATVTTTQLIRQLISFENPSNMMFVLNDLEVLRIILPYQAESLRPCHMIYNGTYIDLTYLARVLPMSGKTWRQLITFDVLSSLMDEPFTSSRIDLFEQFDGVPFHFDGTKLTTNRKEILNFLMNFMIKSVNIKTLNHMQELGNMAQEVLPKLLDKHTIAKMYLSELVEYARARAQNRSQVVELMKDRLGCADTKFVSNVLETYDNIMDGSVEREMMNGPIKATALYTILHREFPKVTPLYTFGKLPIQVLDAAWLNDSSVSEEKKTVNRMLTKRKDRLLLVTGDGTFRSKDSLDSKSDPQFYVNTLEAAETLSGLVLARVKSGLMQPFQIPTLRSALKSFAVVFAGEDKIMQQTLNKILRAWVWEFGFHITFSKYWSMLWNQFEFKLLQTLSPHPFLSVSTQDNYTFIKSVASSTFDTRSDVSFKLTPEPVAVDMTNPLTFSNESTEFPYVQFDATLPYLGADELEAVGTVLGEAAWRLPVTEGISAYPLVRSLTVAVKLGGLPKLAIQARYFPSYHSILDKVDNITQTRVEYTCFSTEKNGKVYILLWMENLIQLNDRKRRIFYQVHKDKDIVVETTDFWEETDKYVLYWVETSKHSWWKSKPFLDDVHQTMLRRRQHFGDDFKLHTVRLLGKRGSPHNTCLLASIPCVGDRYEFEPFVCDTSFTYLALHEAHELFAKIIESKDVINTNIGEYSTFIECLFGINHMDKLEETNYVPNYPFHQNLSFIRARGSNQIFAVRWYMVNKESKNIVGTLVHWLATHGFAAFKDMSDELKVYYKSMYRN